MVGTDDVEMISGSFASPPQAASKIKIASQHKNCRLSVIVKRGFDDHHMVEASFKALGTALRRATVVRSTVLSMKDKPKLRRG